MGRLDRADDTEPAHCAEMHLSQPQGNQKRRNRGRPAGPPSQSASSDRPNRAAELQARFDPNGVEDAATFWARSNARLGFSMTPVATAGRRNTNGRQLVECQCAACGAEVMAERAPKHRHEVMCDACRAALGGMLRGEERAAAEQVRRAHNMSRRNQRQDGIPEFTAEDLEALAEMRAMRDLGNGRVGNTRTPGQGGGGGGGGGERRSQGQRKGNPQEADEEAAQRRRRKRRGRDDEGGGNEAE